MIPPRQQNVAAIPFDQRAADRTSEHVEDFTADLALQAKVCAHAQGDYLVLERHVDEALAILTKGRE